MKRWILPFLFILSSSYLFFSRRICVSLIGNIYCIALILSLHSFNIPVSSSTVVALSMAILVCRKSGMPLKIGEAAR